jgi:hypothetical protein
MAPIRLKSANRKTQVSRAAVRAAVSGLFGGKTKQLAKKRTIKKKASRSMKRAA